MQNHPKMQDIRDGQSKKALRQESMFLDLQNLPVLTRLYDEDL